VRGLSVGRYCSGNLGLNKRRALLGERRCSCRNVFSSAFFLPFPLLGDHLASGRTRYRSARPTSCAHRGRCPRIRHRKSHLQHAQYALEFFFVGFPRASAAHEREIQQPRLTSHNLGTQSVRSATRSIFREHRHKRLDIEAASRAAQRQIAVSLAPLP